MNLKTRKKQLPQSAQREQRNAEQNQGVMPSERLALRVIIFRARIVAHSNKQAKPKSRKTFNKMGCSGDVSAMRRARIVDLT